MTRTSSNIHPRFTDVDVIIVDEEDVQEIWPVLDEDQRLYVEDKYCDDAWNMVTDEIGPGLAQVHTHESFTDDNVLDLREE